MSALPGPELRSLARAVGVADRYEDERGRVRKTRTSTRKRILKAMGFSVASGKALRDQRRLLEIEREQVVLEDVRVVRSGTAASRRVDVRFPEGARCWTLSVYPEQGGVITKIGGVRSGVGMARISLPEALGPGYHRIEMQVDGAGKELHTNQMLVIAPRRCWSHRDAGVSRPVGLMANLYSVRSKTNFGVGDLGDARALARLSGNLGASFLGLNPLHSIRNTRKECSPYSPVSRLFHNPLYLDLTAVPEARNTPAIARQLASKAFEERVAPLRSADRIDYDEVRRLKEDLFTPLHQSFVRSHRNSNSGRGRAYRRFLEERGQALTDHATFMVLDEILTPRCGSSRWWSAWPEMYRDPRSAAVKKFREKHFEKFDRHRYLAFEMDRQLGAVGKVGEKAGLGLGLYGDLALGPIADGSDVWANQDLFVRGASLGAPPDSFCADGQLWNLPPIHPLALKQRKYDHWIEVLQSAMRYSGVLRIDHVIGLCRAYWIPRGVRTREGAPVYYPADDLFGIIALESMRNETVVVGEDLGTLPAELPSLMHDHGLISSRVFLSQRKPSGRFLSASKYPSQALVTASTHDHPPIAGWLEGTDLPMRRRLGLLASDASLKRAKRERRRDREFCTSLLRAEGLLPRTQEAKVSEINLAIQRFLQKTPTHLVAHSLDDLTGETEPVNFPGVTSRRYPSWSRRMCLPRESFRQVVGLEDVFQPNNSGAIPRPKRPERKTRGTRVSKS